MILGKWELPPYAMLAPMAGVSDRALRELAMRFGAVACVGEMVSCKGLVQGSRKSAELMEIGPLEMPCATRSLRPPPATAPLAPADRGVPEASRGPPIASRAFVRLLMGPEVPASVRT